MNNSFIAYAEPYKMIPTFFCFLKGNIKLCIHVCKFSVFP